MLSHIMAAPDGTVFQATGPMCTSYSLTATKGFGKHRIVIRYAKGAKAVESFASGGFASEKEVTTLPNSRFILLSKKMVPDTEQGPGRAANARRRGVYPRSQAEAYRSSAKRGNCSQGGGRGANGHRSVV